jgi:hypothetical protein
MAVIDDSDMIVVKNMTDGIVGFRDQMTNRLYSFSPNQPMSISAGTLRALSYSSGGLELLQNYLTVENTELREEFNISPDMVEYDWDQQKVDSVLLEGTLDELLDALDFGPTGIKELIVSRAVALDLPDVHKREAIQEKTGANITNIITAAKTNEEDAKEAPSGRRTAKKKTTSGRRTSTATKPE